jgi:hypothetical protein
VNDDDDDYYYYSCEYVEYAVADSLQRVVPCLEDLGEGLVSHRKKVLVVKCPTGPRNWCAHVNTVINLRVPYKAGYLLTS